MVDASPETTAFVQRAWGGTGSPVPDRLGSHIPTCRAELAPLGLSHDLSGEQRSKLRSTGEAACTGDRHRCRYGTGPFHTSSSGGAWGAGPGSPGPPYVERSLLRWSFPHDLSGEQRSKLLSTGEAASTGDRHRCRYGPGPFHTEWSEIGVPVPDRLGLYRGGCLHRGPSSLPIRPGPLPHQFALLVDRGHGDDLAGIADGLGFVRIRV